MENIQLTDYEYTLCVLFSEESARSQQKIVFGNHKTNERSNRRVREDTLCGKLAEVAIAKWLRENYKLHLPVNYEVYPRGEWDDEDIIVNGKTIDIKATQNGRFLLLEENKVNFRQKQGKLPDMFIMCRTEIEKRTVDIVGCISSKRLVSPENDKVKRLREGDLIPGTQVKIQTNNYCVAFSDLSSVKTAFDYILKSES